MSGKRALVLGASGLVGSELLKRITSSYAQVEVLSRRSTGIVMQRVTEHVVDYNSLEKAAKHFQVDDVYCCLGTTIKKAKTKEAFRRVDYEYPLKAAQLAQDAGADQFLVITAMGADAKSSIFYSRVKGELEQSLAALSLPALHIFRPSLLVGKRQEFRFGEQVAIWTAPVMRLLLRGPLRRYRPIEASQVACGMLAAANSASTSDASKSGIHIYSSHEIEQLAAMYTPIV
ncbi:NAD-dependent epimerase/dehydratase family protein [Paenibacillus marinisediminis]